MGDRALRVVFVVTEYPKTTETFIMRDVMALHRLGFIIKINHLTAFKRNEVVHDFARPTLDWAEGSPFVFSIPVAKSVIHYLSHRPGEVFRIVKDIVIGSRSNPVMLLKSLYILPKSMRFAREARAWGADHVHAAYAGHPTTTAWIIRRLEGINFSVSSHAHDLFETQALLDVKLPEASFVRTISEFNKRFILSKVPALQAAPPIVIHVGTEIGPAPDREARPYGPFRILYVGSLESRKGVDTLLRAVAALDNRDWCLDILGDGPERRSLEKLTRKLGLTGKVVFHGRVSSKSVQRAMRESDVLAVPSRIGPRNQTEGLPTVIVEALSVELPVIASRLTGIPEIVHHEETGLLIEVDDVQGLSEALSRVKDQEKNARLWARRGRELVAREFSQARNAELLAGHVMETVIASNGAA